MPQEITESGLPLFIDWVKDGDRKVATLQPTKGTFILTGHGAGNIELVVKFEKKHTFRLDGCKWFWLTAEPSTVTIAFEGDFAFRRRS